MLHLQLVFTCFGGAEIDFMDEKHDAIAFAASLIFKAVIVAAKYSGRIRILPGIQIMFGLLTPQSFSVGDYGPFTFVLLLTISPAK